MLQIAGIMQAGVTCEWGGKREAEGRGTDGFGQVCILALLLIVMTPDSGHGKRYAVML